MMSTAISAATIDNWPKRCFDMAGNVPNSDLIDAVRASATRLGISPHDLLTAMSYETGGKLSPSMYGGAGGRHLGLIQFGPSEQAKYGVRPDQSAPEQVVAAENFLRDRGLKPGMGLLDIYSTINAGRPGLYNRSDANNGGAPGNVADKVASMGAHRMRASALLGGEAPALPQAASAATVAAPAEASAPLSLAPAAVAPDPLEGLLATMTKTAQAANADPGIQAPALTINFPMPPGLARARAAVLAMNKGMV